MTISETNLKLLKAERMTDFTDGGGKMTSSEVVDGQVNNLFNDISELDRAYGRVSLRKVYGLVQTDNTDTYLGAHVILTDPPDDPHVNVTLFTTESWTDERVAARDRIESYSIQGPEGRWVLYGDHIVGQKMLRCYSVANAESLGKPVPDASFEEGDILMLKQEKAGYDQVYQFIRVTKVVSRETKVFTDESGNFYKDVLIFEIGNPLTYLFHGAVVTRLSNHGSPTLVRTTSVADAAEYYGVKKLVENVNINDVVLNVGTPYASLVPSSTKETGMVDVVAGMAKVNYKQAGLANALTASATLSGSSYPEYADDLYLGRGLLPGSLSLTILGSPYKDDNNGNIVLVNGSAGTYGGTVDYSTGHIQITKASAWSGVVSATATAAVAVYDNARTISTLITVNNRAFNYVQTLTPVPTPTSLTVDYKAMNKWYRLYDDGTGKLASPLGSAVGSGTIDYATGSVLVTLGAMPDIDSAVIYSWTTPTLYAMQTQVLNPKPPRLKATLTDVPVKPGSLTVTWNDGTAKSATTNNVGEFSGDAIGQVIWATGELELFPTHLPAANTVFHFSWEQDNEFTDTFTVNPDPNGVITIALSHTPIRPGSISLTTQKRVPASDSTYYTGIGVLSPPDNTVPAYFHDDGVGSIPGTAMSAVNYNTGEVTFDATGTTTIQKLVGVSSTYDAGGWQHIIGFYWQFNKPSTTYHPAFEWVTVPETIPSGTVLLAKYTKEGLNTLAKTLDVAMDQVKFDLTTATNDDIVAGSVKFVFAGETYFDRQGLIYKSLDVLTNSATQAGTIDYQTGQVTLTNWSAGSNTLTLKGLVTTPGSQYATSVFFRTPATPLAVGQFQVNAVARNGDIISGSANNNGEISGEYIKGHIDWLSGVGVLAFGKSEVAATLPDAMKEATWYNPANIDESGNIFVPMLVKPETVKFNAVLISYMPLDADILGVDTVRLPQDGKVPIYRIGNVAVVHDTQTYVLPDNPAVAGATYNLGRTLLSYAKVYDANGLIVPTSKYTTDLDAGTITMANPLSLAGFVQPLKVEHRIEDMSLITDVQITGQITLMKPVRHAYSAASAMVSSALVIGDMQARVGNVFDQQTWTNVYSDTLIGSPAGASYNDVLYPILVTNAGAIQERWAIVFTGSTTFNLYGEYSGLIANGNTGVDFAPVNPITNVPYFHMSYIGWGNGWAAGNVLRFNTLAANYPMWLARTTLQSDPAVYTDNFKLQIRGDAN